MKPDKFFPRSIYIRIFSADYYGTLDLDGLRNTEVQAGLAPAPEAAPVKVAPKKPVTSRPSFRPRPVTEVLVVEEEPLAAV